ncbi:DUF6415 family natural product biosynthesis protein [Streptomyces sp. MS2.AVA.5]|uniref:DUF6415 family natural product biosynthesis protein n=1 Tax=Streptomyces achmelvichensis TaxID=3134111 RepID=A0ACC6PLY3_9ACTN
MTHHSVVHDPAAVLDDALPLDRECHTRLVAAVLAWQPTAPIPTGECAQISLQLTGHARLLIADLTGLSARLPDSDLRTRTRIVPEEAKRRLTASTPGQGSIAGAQNRARLVQALYRSFDRCQAEEPKASATAGGHGSSPVSRRE